MPPGPGYNWICVLSSAAEIIGHAARYRATQVTRFPKDEFLRKRADVVEKSDGRPDMRTPKGTLGERMAATVTEGRDLEQRRVAFLDVSELPETSSEDTKASTVLSLPPTLHTKERSAAQVQSQTPEQPSSIVDAAPSSNSSPATSASFSKVTDTSPHIVDAALTATPQVQTVLSPLVPTPEPATALNIETAATPPSVEVVVPSVSVAPSTPRNTLQSSKVPSSKLGRLFHYGGLAASIGYGAASELLRPSPTSSAASNSNRSAVLSDANISRLVAKLSQMRGAALKLGQFLSIQDTHLLPTEVDAVFRRVQDSAHYMPDWQMEQVLTSSLGPSWSSEYFETFNRIPFAAASIGQVHEGVLKGQWTPSGQPEKVAVKVQFPNIRDSISADLSYITWLLRVTLGGKVLPRGLFLDRTMEVMKSELADECDYVREAHYLREFRSPEFLGTDSRFHVPWVSSISSETVLVMEFVEGGVSLGSEVVTALPQEKKDQIATTILHLCLLELFRFGTMQTDPNYSNFLHIPDSGTIALIDFGATREYGTEFLDGWRRLLEAAASVDFDSISANNEVARGPSWDACIEESIKLGYLVGGEGQGAGFESSAMLNAHVMSLAMLAHPFNPKTPQPVRFGKGSDFGKNTERIRNELIPVMLRDRKKGPPRETYSLNRKLSGAFLLASRLGATVHARDIWENVLGS